MTDEALLARLAAIEQRLDRLEADFAPYRTIGARITADGRVVLGEKIHADIHPGLAALEEVEAAVRRQRKARGLEE
jgi:hypothetical protein